MLCFYVGGDTRMYPDYLDRFTGRMLEAEPGAGVYDIDVAPGRNPGLPVPPGDGRWAAVSGEVTADPDAEALPETPQEPAGEQVPEPGPEVPPEPPEGGQEHQDEPGGEPAPEDTAAPEGEPEPPDPAAETATDPEGVE